MMSVFARDVTAAMFMSQNNEMAAILVSQTNPMGPSLCSYSNLSSQSTDVLFSEKIVERANENNKPWDMTANARGWGVGKRKE